MILKSHELVAESSLFADLCIVGSGAAGITLALEFLNHQTSVIVLTGGGDKESSFATNLYRGSVQPPGSHEPLDENRRRVFGGTTTAWGGRCIPFDAIDYEQRPWVPYSGWPISFDDLQAYHQRACRLAEVGEAEFDARRCFPNAPQEMLAGFDDPSLVTWPLERWSPPTNFARHYRTPLKNAKNIRVLLDAHAIEIGMGEDGQSVRKITAQSRAGNRFDVFCKTFVLAAGGLENPRLLLTSKGQNATGIGNESDQVGRFYQSHLFGVHGHVELKNPSKGFVYNFERDLEGVYCRRRFWPTSMAQRDLEMGNIVGFFFRPDGGHKVHRNALFSAVYLAKAFKGAVARGGIKGLRQLWEADNIPLLEHASIVAKDAPSLVPKMAYLAFHRFFARRRIPFVLPPQSTNQYSLFFQSEHFPNPESRIVLDQEKDSFGIPRIQARVNFSNQDSETVIRFYQMLEKRFQSTGIGILHYNKNALAMQLEASMKAFNSNAHHIGTTRMGHSSAVSVVNANCRVHSTKNLFVAGSSVFPTSGHANPTLTIIALTLRLADHLKRK